MITIIKYLSILSYECQLAHYITGMVTTLLSTIIKLLKMIRRKERYCLKQTTTVNIN